MLIIAYGLLRLMRWARYAAIVVLFVNLVQFLIRSTRDIRIMSDRSGGNLSTISLSIIIVVLFIAFQIAVIWWLSKRSTKMQFEQK